jgi:hypothetical protein
MIPTDHGAIMSKQVLALALLAAFCGAVRAQTVDLVIHNGFEGCWSQALTETQFLNLLQATNNGQITCLPQTTQSLGPGAGSISSCNLPQCPGGAIGCPVTQVTGAFSGDFTRTSGAFSASGNADGLIVPVWISSPVGSGSCTIGPYTIALTYDVAFFETPDGNSGDYMAYQTSISESANDNFGTSTCISSIANVLANSVHTQIQTLLVSAMNENLNQAGVTQSVCPLTP